MAKTAQISKEKRKSITTLRHEGQSMQNKCAVAKTIKVNVHHQLALTRIATGKEEPELPLLHEDKFIRVTILSTSFTWNTFPTVLKEFPHMLSTCWLLFLHSPVQLIPNHLNWVEVG
jgi:hypothetical protein